MYGRTRNADCYRIELKNVYSGVQEESDLANEHRWGTGSGAGGDRMVALRYL